MEPHIQRELVIARKAALFGTILITCFALFQLILIVIDLLAFHFVGVTETYTALWWIKGTLADTCKLAHLSFLARFLWSFSSCSRHDYHKLSSMLTVSACALLAAQVFEYRLKPLTETIEVFSGPIPVSIVPSDGAFRLSIFSAAILILCVAVLLRYVDALREDSDAFI